MNEIGMITMTVMLFARLVLPFGLVLLVGALVNRRMAATF